MEEIRKNNIVELHFAQDKVINATVADYSNNRINLRVNEDFLAAAKEVKPLDNLMIIAYTDFGIKKTFSSVIEKSEDSTFITVENNQSVPVIQKRDFVRISSDISFVIKKDGKFYNCSCINISGGGIAFKADGLLLKPDETVKMIFHSKDFERDIYADAIILNVNTKKTTAKFTTLNKYDEAKIVKYIFRKSAKGRLI